jgi:hypothetical protein
MRVTVLLFLVGLAGCTDNHASPADQSVSTDQSVGVDQSVPYQSLDLALKVDL